MSGIILDLGCGRGNKLYSEFGSVIGLDICLYSLISNIVGKSYKGFVHANGAYLPFDDNYFDYVVSSNVLEHVPVEQKNKFYTELYRVMKRGGIMAHVIQTDSKNMCSKLRHKYPDLFKKYSIERMGDHFGPEMPTATVERIRKHGFLAISEEKMWGPILPVGTYVDQFNNEYRAHSKLLRCFVFCCKIINSNIVTERLSGILLNFVNYFVNKYTSFNNAQALLLVYKKPD